MKQNRWGLLLGATLAVSSGACGSHLVSPAQGGSTWVKLDTPHFTLYTDVPADEAQATAAELEASYGLLEDVAFPYAKKPAERFEITLLQRKNALHEFDPGGPAWLGLFRRKDEAVDMSKSYISHTGPRERGSGTGATPGLPVAFEEGLTNQAAFDAKSPDLLEMQAGATDDSHDLDGGLMVAYHAGLQATERGPSGVKVALEPELRAHLQHALARRFVAHYFPAAPPWLTSGLAEFYRTMHQGKGEAVAGLPPPFRLYGARFDVTQMSELGVHRALPAPPSAAALLASEANDNAADPTDRAVRDVASWNLVHAMRTGQPALRGAFNDYLIAINKGEEPRAAWGAALRRNNVSPDQVEAEYRQSFERAKVPPAEKGGPRLIAQPYSPKPAAKAEPRPMTEAEVRTLWARLRRWDGEGGKKAGEDLNAALKADPSFAQAYALRGTWHAEQGRHQEALADLRKAVSLAPGDVGHALALASYLDKHVEKSPQSRAEHEGELKTLVEGLHQGKGSAEAFAYLASRDIGQGEHARALATLRGAFAINPACSGCYRAAARAFAGLQCYEQAVVAQRKALGSSWVASQSDVTTLASYKQGLAANRQPPPQGADAAPGQAPASACKLVPGTPADSQAGTPPNAAGEAMLGERHAGLICEGLPRSVLARAAPEEP